jgi:AraC family transcriptional regulator of adaptative response/methylated-DNA-[protein]-cysteine methyltransferase
MTDPLATSRTARYEPAEMRGDDSSRWRALVARDARRDGAFVYGVSTTGVCCRPSCASRRPLRRNVEFFDDLGAAVARGYRPCKRCRPERPSTDLEERLARACAALSGETWRPVKTVAAELGWSAAHFARLFRARLGVTPRAWVQRQQRERVKAGLAGARSVTEAVFDAGFSSSSRFYAGAAKELSMRPAAARAGGAGEQVRFATARCALGVVLLAWTARGVCDVRLGDSPRALERELRERFFRATVRRGRSPLVRQVVASVERRSDARLPLDVRGTAFQQRVWEALQRIPAGQTRSYAEVAAAVGAPRASRAVASACAANTLAVLIPCHRVVPARDGMGGYRWGAQRKARLLTLEGRSSTRGPRGTRRA